MRRGPGPEETASAGRVRSARELKRQFCHGDRLPRNAHCADVLRSSLCHSELMLQYSSPAGASSLWIRPRINRVPHFGSALPKPSLFGTRFVYLLTAFMRAADRQVERKVFGRRTTFGRSPSAISRPYGRTSGPKLNLRGRRAASEHKGRYWLITSVSSVQDMGKLGSFRTCSACQRCRRS